MPEFQEQNLEAIEAFIRAHPLALLTAAGDAGPVATHVPLLLETVEQVKQDESGDSSKRFRLRGHVMRKTPYWDAFRTAGEVLAVFTGPDAPVLASWLSDQRFGGTWNYMAVHVRGKLTYLPEEDLVEILRDLKDLHETEPGAKFDHLPPDYVPSLIRAIEGFEIVATSVQAVFKLSQNRSQADFDSVAMNLEKEGGEAALVAQEMKKRRDSYFPGRVSISS